MLEPNWYLGWKGNKKYLPRSERQGHQLAQKVLIPLQAQIAVFFGVSDGSMETLRRGAMKLSKGEPIYCEVCQRNIWVELHQKDCELVRQYNDVMSKEPSPVQ